MTLYDVHVFVCGKREKTPVIKTLQLHINEFQNDLKFDGKQRRTPNI